MKNILFILLLIPTLIYCQEDVRVKDLDAATDPDADDILYFEEDDVAKNITKALLQKSVTDITDVLRTDVDNNEADITAVDTRTDELSDSVIINVDDIDYNEATSTANAADHANLIETLDGLAGWVMEVTDDGDSLQFTYLGSIIIKVEVGSAVIPDIYVPTIEEVEVGTLGADEGVITMSEAMDEASVPATTAFTIVASGGAVTVSDVDVTDDEVFIGLSREIETGEILTLSYTKPGSNPLRDIAENELASVSDLPVVLNIDIPTDVVYLCRFENNLTKDTESSATWDLQHEGNDAVAYNTGGSETCEGSYSLNVGDWHLESDAAVTFAEDWTISGWIYDGTTEAVPFFSIDNYLNVWVDYVNDVIETQSLQGGAQTGSSTQQSGVMDWTCSYIALRYMDWNGTSYLTTWLDGTDITSDSVVGDCSAMNDIFRYGSITGESGSGYNDLDALSIYPRGLTTAEMVWLAANSGETIGGGGTPDPDPEPDAFDIYLSFDPADMVCAIDADITEAVMLAESAQWENPYPSNGFKMSEEGSRAIHGTDTVIDVLYVEGHCCDWTGNDYCGTPNTGSGMYMNTWFDDPGAEWTDLTHGYLTYEIEVGTNWMPNNRKDCKMPGVESQNYDDKAYSEGGKDGAYVKMVLCKEEDDELFFKWLIHPYMHDNGTEYPFYKDAGDQSTAQLTPGQKYTVTMRWSLNTDGNADGFCEFFIDKQIVDYHGGLEIVKDPEDPGNAFSRLQYDTHMGGGDCDWANSQDMHLYMGKFCVWDTDDVDLPERHEPSSSNRVLELPPFFDGY